MGGNPFFCRSFSLSRALLSLEYERDDFLFLSLERERDRFLCLRFRDPDRDLDLRFLGDLKKKPYFTPNDSVVLILNFLLRRGKKGLFYIYLSLKKRNYNQVSNILFLKSIYYLDFRSHKYLTLSHKYLFSIILAESGLLSTT